MLNAYYFLAFSDLTCHLEYMGSIVFWLHCAADSNEIKLESSNQEASASAGKNIRIVLVPYLLWKCLPTAISSGLDISEVPVCHLL